MQQIVIKREFSVLFEGAKTKNEQYLSDPKSERLLLLTFKADKTSLLKI